MFSLLLNYILESWIDQRKLLLMDCSQKIAPLSGQCFTECSSRFLVAHRDIGKISNERGSGMPHTQRIKANSLVFSSHGKFFSPKLMRFREFGRNIPCFSCQSSRFFLSWWSLRWMMNSTSEKSETNLIRNAVFWREVPPKFKAEHLWPGFSHLSKDKTKPSVLASHFDLLDVENSSAMMFPYWHFSVIEINTLLYQVCACVCRSGCNFTAWLGRPSLPRFKNIQLW